MFVLAAMLGMVFGTVGVADADATLVGSDPPDGATVRQWPSTVGLAFNERVTDLGLSVQVTGPDGQSYLAGSPTADAASVLIPLASGGPSGTYTVAYRVVSADGHPVQGQLSFELTAATTPSPAAAPKTPFP